MSQKIRPKVTVMTIYQKTENKISIAKTVDCLAQQTLLQETSHYQLVEVVRVSWERLDDDRTGSHFDIHYYPLQGAGKCHVDFAFIVENDHLAGIVLKHNSADNWPSTIGKRSMGNCCALFVDGTVVGQNEIVETHDTPNDQDIVKTTYSLKKIY